MKEIEHLLTYSQSMEKQEGGVYPLTLGIIQYPLGMTDIFTQQQGKKSNSQVSEMIVVPKHENERLTVHRAS